MNGSSDMTRDLITLGHTCKPSMMLIAKFRTTSVPRNASGRVNRRLAESSRVRSNHWFDAVFAALDARGIAAPDEAKAGADM